MGLSVEIPGVPSGVHVDNIGVWRQIGDIARAQFSCDFAAVTALKLPDPASLRGKSMTVWGSPTVAILPGSGAIIFRGTIVDAEVGYWPPDRLMLRVAAIEGPLGALPSHQLDGAWLSFAKDSGLKAAAKTLLEHCGFQDVKFGSGIDDKLPADLLCAGRSPWHFLHSLLRVHAAGLAMRADKEGKTIMALVRQAKDLAGIGHDRRCGLGAQQKQTAARTITHIGVARSKLPPEAGLGWWDAASEKGGVAGPKTRIAPTPLWPSETMAKSLQQWQKARDRANDIVIHLSTDDPEVSLGDRLAIEGGLDSARLGWLSSYLDAEPLYATGIHIQMVGSSQRVSTTVEAVPGSAAAVRWTPATPQAESLVQVVTGEVKEMPPEQGQMKVVLDVDVSGGGRPVIHCEWMSPCYSGAGGALHMPPLPGDKVRLAVESLPYGRVLYLGAVPGDQRLAKVRNAIAGHYEAARPANNQGKEDSPMSLPGDHLARAIGASPKNLSVWVSPGAGLGAKEPEEKAARWSVIASESNQISEVVRPTLHLQHSAGQGVKIERKMEGNQLIQSTKGIEINAKTDIQILAENTKIHSKTEFSSIADQKSSIHGGQEATLTSKKVSIKGTVSDEIEGGTITITSKGPLDVHGLPIKLNC